MEGPLSCGSTVEKGKYFVLNFAFIISLLLKKRKRKEKEKEEKEKKSGWVLFLSFYFISFCSVFYYCKKKKGKKNWKRKKRRRKRKKGKAKEKNSKGEDLLFHYLQDQFPDEEKKGKGARLEKIDIDLLHSIERSTGMIPWSRLQIKFKFECYTIHPPEWKTIAYFSSNQMKLFRFNCLQINSKR